MSKKKKASQATPAPDPEIPIEDDPYWKVSHLYLDEHRAARHVERFEKYFDEQPDWVDHILDGLPTYYCILGVRHGATPKQVRDAFDRRFTHSIYPRDVILEASVTLEDPDTQREYDEFLVAFERYTTCLLPSEKRELIKQHREYVEEAKEAETASSTISHHLGYLTFVFRGMPDIYTVAGISPDASIREVQEACAENSPLMNQVRTILCNPATRNDYDFLHSLVDRRVREEDVQDMGERQERWKRLDPATRDSIVLLTLREPQACLNHLTRFGDTLNTNQDWAAYIPPSPESFFSIIGIDPRALPAGKKEVASLLREKYRDLDRTPQVNLAYSVLKNAELREEYFWVYEHAYLKAVFDIFNENRTTKMEGASMDPGMIRMLQRIFGMTGDGRKM